jgi:hypothetical protein
MEIQMMALCTLFTHSAFADMLTSFVLSLTSASMPPLVLDMAVGNPVNGSRICLWPRYNGLNQKWRIQGFE